MRRVVRGPGADGDRGGPPRVGGHIRRLVDPESQADPKFQTPFAYTRVTARAVREALLAVPELAGTVPSRQTVGDVLNRLGYKLRRVLKARPQKVPRDRRRLAHVRDTRTATAADPGHLEDIHRYQGKSGGRRLSRGSRARGREAVEAVDHDMAPEAVLVPFGSWRWPRAGPDRPAVVPVRALEPDERLPGRRPGPVVG